MPSLNLKIPRLSDQSESLKTDMKDCVAQGECSVHCGLPSTCSHIQMSSHSPPGATFIIETISSPSKRCRDIRDDIKGGLQRTVCLCFLAVPHYYLLKRQWWRSTLHVVWQWAYLSGREREREREKKHHMINDAYSVWLSGAEKASRWG